MYPINFFDYFSCANLQHTNNNGHHLGASQVPFTLTGKKHQPAFTVNKRLGSTSWYFILLCLHPHS